jgi:hypothetical protein
VLDPRQAPSLSETLRQLRYRNAFAARLANLGPGPAVLATGLGRLALDQPRQMEDALIAAISGGRTLGAIAAILRRQAPPGATSLEEVLGPLATALFCRDPEERAPGSGLTAGG